MKKIIPVLVAILVFVGYFIYNNGIKEGNSAFSKAEEIPALISRITSNGLAPNSSIEAKVIKIVDGDTIDIKYKRKTYRVRLLDIDTPESVKNGIPVQNYSEEATEFIKKLTMDKTVKLVFDKGLRDKYGRLLAYVILDGRVFVNALLVSKGYARVEIVSPNDSFADYFYKLEGKAVEEKVGLWGLSKDKQPFVKDNNGHFIPRYWVDQTAS